MTPVHLFEQGFCRTCGADGSSSLTGGSPCAGPPLVDIIDFDGPADEDGTVRSKGVPLSDCFPDADEYAAALAVIVGRDAEYWVGGGAAPLVLIRLARAA